MSAGAAPRNGRIGWFTGLCLLISNVIGGGIFTVTGYLARDLGDPILILALWVCGALIALAGAYCYSELGAALPHVGGDYVYLRHAYGPLVAFLSGWVSFTVGFGAAIAASAVSFSAYAFRGVFGIQEPPIAPVVPALVLVWLLTALHAQGLSVGGWVQRVLTSVKVSVLLALIVGGLAFGEGNWDHFFSIQSESRPQAGAVAVALVFIFYTYLGWNVAGYVAGELADPTRWLPKIVVGGTICVAALYFLINVVYFFALPVTVLGEPPLLPVADKAAAALWGTGGARLLALLLCLSISGAVSAMIWAGPRVYWAMAQDGMFLTYFARLDSKRGVPVRAIVLQGLWASVLILTGSFEQLVVFGGSVLALFTALTVGAVFVLRRRYPEWPRPYRVPGYPVGPALFVLTMNALLSTILVTRPDEAVMGLLTLVAGAVCYRLFFMPTSRDRG
jgi:APA family basic amino acid/polyamine antiporter